MGKKVVEMIAPGIGIEYEMLDAPVKKPFWEYKAYPVSKIPNSEVKRLCERMRELLNLPESQLVMVSANESVKHWFNQYDNNKEVVEKAQLAVRVYTKIGDHEIVCRVANYGHGYEAYWDSKFRLEGGKIPKMDDYTLVLTKFPEGWVK